MPNVTMAMFQSDMNNEFKRYATFSGFRGPDGVWPLQLARAGFYRSGNCEEFQVVCFACGLVLDLRTVSRDSVMENHRQLAPNCSFVTGCSDNQPVPPIDTAAAFEWLSHAFSFDLESVPSRRDQVDSGQFSHRPTNTQGSNGTGSASSETVDLPEIFTLSQIFSQLPSLSDLNTLEDTGLSTLPMDFLNGFANTTLDSVPTAQLFPSGGNHQSSHQFGSSLTAPDEILVTDGVQDGVEGVFPPPSMPDSEISSYTNATQQPHYIEELGETGITQKLTFGDLGIVTERPKRPELAPLQKRLETFDHWMGPAISQSKESIAEAGLYYAGYHDCCRCFYCGGGLKSWEPEDDPWVEHARWFKDCPFVITNKGKEFIQAVHLLGHSNSNVQMSDVDEEMNRIKLTTHQPAEGWLEEEEMDMHNGEDDNVENEAERLQDENMSLRQPELCKICMDSDVSIVYVPCGHLVTCGTCAPTVKNCPVCRVAIGGQIRIQR